MVVRRARPHPYWAMKRLLSLLMIAASFAVPAAAPAQAAAPSIPRACALPAADHGYGLITLPGPGLTTLYALTSQARVSLDLVIYELSDPTELADLAAAAARGVSVHVILDYAYSGYYVNAPAYAYLRAHRVAVAWAPASTIVHEKALAVDGTCAAIGTGNLTPRYYSSTRDYWVVDTHPNEVAAIAATARADFARPSLAPAVPAGNLLYSPGAETPLVRLIDSATRSVTFESEELDEAYIVDALAADARRGLSCTVVMVDSSSWHSAFATLAAAGCAIRLYSPSSGLYIHAKTIVVDPGTTHARVFVGSQNASYSSLMYNRELGLVLTAQTAPVLVRSLAASVATDAARAPMTYR